MLVPLIQLVKRNVFYRKGLFMKALGFIFVAILLVALGIIAVKLGWFDAVANWFGGFFK